MSTENNTAETGTDLTLLEPAQRAVIILNSPKTELALVELVKETASIVAVVDSVGREQAHRAAMKLKNSRLSIEKTGKTARDDATKFSQAVIAEEKRLKALITDEEDRVFALRDAYDAKVKAEKEEADRIEAARLARIAGKIDYIRGLPLASFRDSAADIQATIDDLSQFDLVDGFDEKQEEAEAARATALAELAKLLETAQATEVEAERVRQQAAQLEQERLALAAERKRIDDEAAAERAELAQFRAEKAQREAAATLAAEAAAPDYSDPVGQPTVGFEPEAPLAGGTHYSTTVFKENGDPVLLNEDGSRSVFCDVDEGGPDETVETVVTVAEEAPAATEEAPPTWAPGNLIYEICQTTGLQFHEMSKKVAAAGFYDFAAQLITIADQLMDGAFKDQVAAADSNAFFQADFELCEIALRARGIWADHVEVQEAAE